MQRPLDSSTDTLSTLARKLLKLGFENTYSHLVVAGHGNHAAKATLESVSPRDLLEGPIISSDDGDAMLAGLWLRHDWLDESHRISQGIDSPTGSFWHAMMHRREGDFSNSKYWYRRCEAHPTFATLAIRAGDIINPYPADKSVFRITAQGWNPSAFVDLVEAVHDKPTDPRHRLAIAIQEIEWQVLFDHCTRAAGGK